MVIALTDTAVAVARYADRLHRVPGEGHHVASPLGAWLLLALCGPASSGKARDQLAEAVGCDLDQAAGMAGALLSEPHPAVAAARQEPLVFLTSNATRELSDALKRRCLYLHLDYPDPDRERQIVELRVPDIMPALARQAARVVHALRSLDLHKPPNISESVDWARSLVLLGVADLDSGAISRTLPVPLQDHRDIEHASAELDLVSSAGRETPP